MKFAGVCVLVLAGCQFSTSHGTFGGGDGDRHNVTMPSLFLMTRAEAEAMIRRAGITGELQVDSNNGGSCGSVVDGKVVELGRVCRQAPAAGQVTSSTLFVSIHLQDETPWRGELSGGRRWFLLPDLAGMTVDQAREKLHALGFSKMDRIQVAYVDEPGCKPNVVCRTYPEAMTRTDNTSDKLIYAGRPLESTPPPPPPGDGNAPPPPGDGKAPPPPGDGKAPPPPKKPSLGDLF